MGLWRGVCAQPRAVHVAVVGSDMGGGGPWEAAMATWGDGDNSWERTGQVGRVVPAELRSLTGEA